MSGDDWFAQVVKELEASEPGTVVHRTFRIVPGEPSGDPVAGFRTLGNALARLPLPDERREEPDGLGIAAE